MARGERRDDHARAWVVIWAATVLALAAVVLFLIALSTELRAG